MTWGDDAGRKNQNMMSVADEMVLAGWMDGWEAKIAVGGEYCFVTSTGFHFYICIASCAARVQPRT